MNNNYSNNNQNPTNPMENSSNSGQDQSQPYNITSQQRQANRLLYAPKVVIQPFYWGEREDINKRPHNVNRPFKLTKKEKREALQNLIPRTAPTAPPAQYNPNGHDGSTGTRANTTGNGGQQYGDVYRSGDTHHNKTYGNGHANSYQAYSSNQAQSGGSQYGEYQATGSGNQAQSGGSKYGEYPAKGSNN